ncbi:hypothetical protein NDU88_006685 [Pleurodeles waltl]|uniref:Solute carrier family 2, facilitated glucose transporter member 5 n=1 Tax=Pleurodeles waltl TaxID=8319 RepID=A0AAV7LPW3_PLEWA|nr:hypothetical protein NDU88_006685 [Pleurodeles waltl]
MSCHTQTELDSNHEFIKTFINQTWIDRYNATVPEETLTLLWSLTVSIFSLGGLLGSLGSAYLIRKYGKRKSQQWNNLLAIGASLIVGCSKMAGSFEMILIGRFFYGINAGLGMNVCLQYLGEIAPKKLRGLINSSAPVYVTAGKLFGQIIGLREAMGTETMWPFLMSVCGLGALLQLITLPLFPDTPPNLLLVQQDKEGCIRAMKKLWGAGDHRADIADLLKEQSIRKNSKVLTFMELMRERSLRPQLCILIVMIIGMQMSGISAIYFYAFDVFRKAGITAEHIPYLAIGIGACEMVGTIFCSLFIDKCGRKMLLLSSLGAMGTSLALLTVTLSMQNLYVWVPTCSIVLIFCFILFFGIGPSGVIIVVSLEILSQEARASAFMIISSLNWTGLYIIGLIFPFMVKSFGQFCFLLFLGCILASWIFVFLFLPETKGKSITEITNDFSKIRCGQICCRGTKEASKPEDIRCTKF